MSRVARPYSNPTPAAAARPYSSARPGSVILPSKPPLAAITDITSWTSIYDGDLGVTLNSTTVSAWADQASASIGLSQGTAGFQPLFVASGLNGHGTVRFDGVDDCMTFASPQPHCMIIAVHKQVTNKNAPWLSSLYGGANKGYTLACLSSKYKATSEPPNGSGADTTFGYTLAAPAPNTSWHMLTADVTDGKLNASSRVMWLDGQAQTTPTSGTGGYGAITSQLGGETAVAFANLEIAWLGFTPTLSDEDLARVTNFLAAKYAVVVHTP